MVDHDIVGSDLAILPSKFLVLGGLRQIIQPKLLLLD
jgi:hypothetical protein